MADFLATTACNNPKVRSAEAVEAVLACYLVNPDLSVGVNYDHDTGEPYLFLYGHGWPEAWQLPEGVLPLNFDPYGEGVFEQGAEGFTALLKDIAPHLKGTLVVHAVGGNRCFFPLSACEWEIAAGGKKVKVTELRHTAREVALTC